MYRRVRRILAATDLSDLSQSLLQTAVEIARQFGAELIALYVFDPAGYAEIFRETRLPLDDYISRLRAAVQNELATVPAQPVRVDVVQGSNAAQGILDAAALASADLIVMGTHGRTGLRRVMLGSVAEEVLRHAYCPVLVVPLAILARVPKTTEPTVAHA